MLPLSAVVFCGKITFSWGLPSWSTSDKGRQWWETPSGCPAGSSQLRQQMQRSIEEQRRIKHGEPRIGLTNLVSDAQYRLFANVTARYGESLPELAYFQATDSAQSGGRPRRIKPDMVAFAMELLMSPVSKQNSAPGGEGSDWFGVSTLQNPVDSVTIASVIWDLKPDLIIEVGTECGGSSLFMSQMLRLLRMDHLIPRGKWGVHMGKVLTYDINKVHLRMCKIGSRAHDSQLWRTLKNEGVLEPRLADVTSPAELAYIEQLASRAQTVLVIDDGDHTATPLIVHFELLSRFVTPGSYYLVQDTRLDRTCRAQLALDKSFTPARPSWDYCKKIIGSAGGPARAVRYLQCASPSFAALNFSVDATREPYVFTQHPGGWLKRAGQSAEQQPSAGVRHVAKPQTVEIQQRLAKMRAARSREAGQTAASARSRVAQLT